MKSFCVKLENEKQKNLLITALEKIEINNFYISSYKFKIYENVIVHYKGNNMNMFLNYLSRAIASVIQDYYEEIILDKIIRKNYFYLNEEEQDSIIRISLRILAASKENDDFSKEILERLIFEYLEINKSMILDGFVMFRIKEYKDALDYVGELAVTSYLNLIEY